MQDAVTGKPIEGDLYDVAVWEKLLLGPWAGGADVSQEMRDHVENALASCRGFRTHLDGGEEILAHPASECVRASEAGGVPASLRVRQLLIILLCPRALRRARESEQVPLICLSCSRA